MAEGIGPSMDVPCKSLQKKYTTVRNARGKGKWNSIQLVLEDTH
jgi:4-aminobutyrate aminotransferase-like enzyme